MSQSSGTVGFALGMISVIVGPVIDSLGIAALGVIVLRPACMPVVAGLDPSLTPASAPRSRASNDLKPVQSRCEPVLDG